MALRFMPSPKIVIPKVVNTTLLRSLERCKDAVRQVGMIGEITKSHKSQKMYFLLHDWILRHELLSNAYALLRIELTVIQKFFDLHHSQLLSLARYITGLNVEIILTCNGLLELHCYYNKQMSLHCHYCMELWLVGLILCYLTKQYQLFIHYKFHKNNNFFIMDYFKKKNKPHWIDFFWNTQTRMRNTLCTAGRWFTYPQMLLFTWLA